MKHSPCDNRRKAYVLLMVLVLLVIAAILSVGVARRSIGMTQRAALRESELQRRWTTISARQAILNRAEILLRLEEQRTGSPVAKMETVLPVGDRSLTLILTDEQSKLNLNMLFRTESLPAVQRLVGTFSTGDFPVRLRPDPNARRDRPYPPAFLAWGQVYDLTDLPYSRADDRRRFLQLENGLTCWGSGQLNLTRAHPAVQRAFWEQTVSPKTANDLIALHAKNPTWPVDRLLREADLTSAERRALRRLLTDRSRCHALWTILEEDQRSWVRLDVHTPDGPSDRETVSFEF